MPVSRQPKTQAPRQTMVVVRRRSQWRLAMCPVACRAVIRKLNQKRNPNKDN